MLRLKKRGRTMLGTIKRNEVEHEVVELYENYYSALVNNKLGFFNYQYDDTLLDIQDEQLHALQYEYDTHYYGKKYSWTTRMNLSLYPTQYGKEETSYHFIEEQAFFHSILLICKQQGSFYKLKEVIEELILTPQSFALLVNFIRFKHHEVDLSYCRRMSKELYEKGMTRKQILIHLLFQFLLQEEIDLKFIEDSYFGLFLCSLTTTYFMEYRGIAFYRALDYYPIDGNEVQRINTYQRRELDPFSLLYHPYYIEYFMNLDFTIINYKVISDIILDALHRNQTDDLLFLGIVEKYVKASKYYGNDAYSKFTRLMLQKNKVDIDFTYDDTYTVEEYYNYYEYSNNPKEFLYLLEVAPIPVCKYTVERYGPIFLGKCLPYAKNSEELITLYQSSMVYQDFIARYYFLYHVYNEAFLECLLDTDVFLARKYNKAFWNERSSTLDHKLASHPILSKDLSVQTRYIPVVKQEKGRYLCMVTLVGVKYQDQTMFTINRNDRVYFSKDLDNTFDSKAIHVVSDEGFIMGYVSKQDASNLYPFLALRPYGIIFQSDYNLITIGVYTTL